MIEAKNADKGLLLLITHSKFKGVVYIPLPKDINKLKNLSFDRVYLKEEIRQYAKKK